jgi:hypothetical protein
MKSKPTKSARLFDARQPNYPEVKGFIFDWRDPDMPCITPAENSQTKEQVGLLMAPEAYHKNAKTGLLLGTGPNWRNDPTYNLRRRK